MKIPGFLRTLSVVGALVAAATVVGTTTADAAQPATKATTAAKYHTWAYGVNVRNGDELRWADCERYPSTTNCNLVQQVINPDWGLVPRCQKAGQTVGGNPNWLAVDVYYPGSSGLWTTGWMASYYIDYPGSVLPIPWC